MIFIIYSLCAFYWMKFINENFKLQSKTTDEMYGLTDNIWCLIIGILLALTWIVSVPMILIPLKMKGEQK